MPDGIEDTAIRPRFLQVNFGGKETECTKQTLNIVLYIFELTCDEIRVDRYDTAVRLLLLTMLYYHGTKAAEKSDLS